MGYRDRDICNRRAKRNEGEYNVFLSGPGMRGPRFFEAAALSSKNEAHHRLGVVKRNKEVR